MQVTVHLYASLAEAAGVRAVALDGLPEPATVADLGDALFARFPALAAMRHTVIYAVNAEYVRADYPVHAGDQVALIPPVSGGATAGKADPDDAACFVITPEVLDVEALQGLVLRPEAGAVSHFVGVVRDNNLGRAVDHLVYDAYPEMARRMMRQIAREIRERWEVCGVAMQHRTGRLEIGEASVAIAVSAPHRRESIAACGYAIDRLKAIVPIWKKEVWTDGEHWIEGSLRPQAEAKAPPAAAPPAAAPPGGD